MANSPVRRSRSAREAQAYRAVQVGTVSAAGFVVTLILSIAGVLGGTIPVILLILTVVMAVRFATVTGMRGRR